MSRLPLPLNIGNNGSYGFVRRDPSMGGCGVGHYPCTHYALDLVAAVGTPVVSPVDGNVVYWVGAIPPFAGFDPSVCVIEDSDTSEPHRYHLLAHLDYTRSRGLFGDNFSTDASGSKWPSRIRKPVRAGQIVGYVGGYKHCHWQVQSAPYQSGGRTWAQLTTDPKAWAVRRGATYGAPVLTPSDMLGPAAAVGLILLATKG